MKKEYTLDDIGRMLEHLIDRLAPKHQAEWVSGYDLRVKFGLKHSEIRRYKETGVMRTKPYKKGSPMLLYDISKVRHLLPQR
jgi:hypothetical protein